MTLTPEGYCPRLVDKDVDLMLRTFRAVSIMGPKWCGKTWTGENHANSEMRIADSTGPIPNRDIVASDPRVAMEGDQPRLIDEWQEVPQLWDKVRSTVDSNPRTGQYILTGSSVPVRQKYVHSGTGRIGTLRMGTMSLYEIGDSDGAVSLLSLFEGELGMVDCGEVWLDHLIDLAIRGGWPGNDGGDGDPGLLARGYVDKVVEDAAYLDGRRRSERKMRMLIRSLARNESTLASNEKIMSDMRESDRETISSDTYTDYMDCLDRLFLTDDTPCFSPNLRSDARIGKSPKRHLVDVSLSIAALRYTKGMLKENLDAFGFMFEAMCEHDIRLYAEYLGGRMFHYRDGRGREMDAVVEMPDGRWGAFEIKLGTGQIEDAAPESAVALGLLHKERTSAGGALRGMRDDDVRVQAPRRGVRGAPDVPRTMRFPPPCGPVETAVALESGGVLPDPLPGQPEVTVPDEPQADEGEPEKSGVPTMAIALACVAVLAVAVAVSVMRRRV